MGDIILNDVTDKEGSEIDTHHRINQIEPVGPGLLERAGEKQNNLVDNPMEGESSDGGEEANKQCQDENKHPVADMLHPPLMQTMKP